MSEIKSPEIGEVVRVLWPLREREGSIGHYGIVIAVSDNQIRLVYGSSKKVSVDGYLPWEFVLHHKDDLDLAGLDVPTRFDAKRIRDFGINEIRERAGHVNLNNRRLAMRLAAALEAGDYTPTPLV